MTRVVGVDFSLTATGWARTDGRNIDVGRFTSKPTNPDLAARSLRLRTLVNQIWNVSATAELVMIEGPAYASQSGHMHERSGGWWLIVARLTGAGIPVVEVPPSVLKTFATGKGNADKDTVLLAAARTFPNLPITGNDMADALWLSALGARYLGNPIDPWPRDLPRDRARALDKLPRLNLTGATPHG